MVEPDEYADGFKPGWTLELIIYSSAIEKQAWLNHKVEGWVMGDSNVNWAKDFVL